MTEEFKVGDTWKMLSGTHEDIKKGTMFQVVGLDSSGKHAVTTDGLSVSSLRIAAGDVELISRLEENEATSTGLPKLVNGLHVIETKEGEFFLVLQESVYLCLHIGIDKKVLLSKIWTNVSPEIHKLYELKPVHDEIFVNEKFLTLVWSEDDTKKVNIANELKLAKAKQQRLQQHIDVLERKLTEL